MLVEVRSGKKEVVAFLAIGIVAPLALSLVMTGLAGPALITLCSGMTGWRVTRPWPLFHHW